MLHITKMVAFYLQAWKKLNIKKNRYKKQTYLEKTTDYIRLIQKNREFVLYILNRKV